MRFHLVVLTWLLCPLLTGTGIAEVLRFDSAEKWQTWTMPQGLIQVDEEGGLRLIKYRKGIDAVRDARLFTHLTQKRGEAYPGGIWAAGSNAGAAVNIVDGDPATYWQPDMVDSLKNWFVDIDLGRTVLARHIRLRFPDEEGARPLRQFTVYATTGARILATEDVFKYDPVYRTSLPNQSTSLTIPLEYPATDTVVAVDSGLDLDLEFENRYQLIQYISITAEEQHADAAIAEVEVLSVGDNISIGTQQRGFFLNGTVAVGPQYLFDADMNTNNLITSGRGDQGWEGAGTWFYVDLGAVFFVDEMFLYVLRPFEGTTGSHRGSAGPGHTIFYSDGTSSIGTNLPVPVPFDYAELLTHIDPKSDGLYRIRYLFKARRMRYLFWHGITDRDWQESKWGEFMLFSPGHPAQVVLLSDFIDLGEISGDDRPKVIKTIHWDADLPAGTKLQLRSRSGNTMKQIYTFYDKKGTSVTEEKWLSSPKVIRGPIDTTVVVGEDWGAWSNIYQFSEESFQSESPRRFVQLEMILSTDDPEVAPQVRALSIEYEEALLQEAKGSILPRLARPNEETRFTYSLWPRANAGDSGFDLLRFTVPGPVDVDDVEVRINQESVPLQGASLEIDSLLIALPAKITSDSLQVSFTTRVLQNATLFSLDLGDSDRPGLWQSVEAAKRRANIIMLPELADSDRLIGDLRISPAIFTPNGDGVNDRLEVSFVPFKVAGTESQVQLFDLSGRLAAELEQTADGARQLFTWSGRNESGALVAPGVYLCRIDMGAESGEDTELRTVVVAY